MDSHLDNIRSGWTVPHCPSRPKRARQRSTKAMARQSAGRVRCGQWRKRARASKAPRSSSYRGRRSRGRPSWARLGHWVPMCRAPLCAPQSPRECRPCFHTSQRWAPSRPSRPCRSRGAASRRGRTAAEKSKPCMNGRPRRTGRSTQRRRIATEKAWACALMSRS